MRPDELLALGCGASLLLGLFALTDRQRYVVVQRHLRGRKLEALAVELGVTRQAVSVCEQTALARLRCELGPLREGLAA